MSRLGRYLVPALLLLPMILLCGKLLLTEVKSSHDAAGISPEDNERLNELGLSGAQAYCRGWPWTFTRSIDSLPAISTVSRQFVTMEFSWAFLFADIAVLLAATAVVFIWLRRRTFGRQFSIQTMFVVVALAGIGSGWLAKVHDQWKREQVLRDRLAKKQIVLALPTYDGPQWLRRLWPEEGLVIFHRADTIDATLQAAPDFGIELESALREMPYLTHVWENTNYPLRVSDPSAYSKVQELKLSASADDTTLELLQPLPCLTYLEISGYNNKGFSDAGLAFVGKYAALESLELQDTRITNAGVAHLIGLKHLRYLDLADTEIADDVMDSLVQMKSLETLSIDRTRVTETAMRRLLELPNLRDVEIATNARRGGSHEIIELLRKRIKNVIDF